jgi:hypothetical protein
LRQIKFGQDIEGLILQEGPKELKKNVEYGVYIGVGDMSGARGAFIIKDGNTVIMPNSVKHNAEHIEDRTVIIEKNGKKTIVPYTVTPNPGGGVRISVMPSAISRV